MNRQQHDRKEARTGNSGFAKWRVQCFYDSLVQGSSSVFQLNICAENPPLRKAENRHQKQTKHKINNNEKSNLNLYHCIINLKLW
ncbi:MAG: hypothetical protein EBS09_09240 [Flavobacteriia bacterium]|nr:hypothetical protein [Flavobacteriia bacterium]